MELDLLIVDSVQDILEICQGGIICLEIRQNALVEDVLICYRCVDILDICQNESFCVFLVLEHQPVNVVFL